jgi:uncharacterized membrane protein
VSAPHALRPTDWKEEQTRPLPTFAEMDQVHGYIEWLARGLELAGVLIILAGVGLASYLFVLQGWRSNWRDAYERYRANLGRGILLGLELLVGADIIGTISAAYFRKRGPLGPRGAHSHLPQLFAGDRDRRLLALAAQVLSSRGSSFTASQTLTGKIGSVSRNRR